MRSTSSSSSDYPLVLVLVLVLRIAVVMVLIMFLYSLMSQEDTKMTMTKMMTILRMHGRLLQLADQILDGGFLHDG